MPHTATTSLTKSPRTAQPSAAAPRRTPRSTPRVMPLWQAMAHLFAPVEGAESAVRS
ncbi:MULTISPECIES: hypothetical protein [unclassified Streptomyces]|uniref:hypothetical protein n=1 Tax=unclassified Streptomyces TaxID=2593676 RepID=UPI00190AE915|nr:MULTISPECIES: hypothetical protein [unclassified Streptomyces]MBK3569341.1 hypothetical protein [Streptomyces sp. MBT62]MBK6016452.1 hypothetical protein [Streptomyces sp. MBT53]